jgi:hypothetical protein
VSVAPQTAGPCAVTPQFNAAPGLLLCFQRIANATLRLELRLSVGLFLRREHLGSRVGHVEETCPWIPHPHQPRIKGNGKFHLGGPGFVPVRVISAINHKANSQRPTPSTNPREDHPKRHDTDALFEIDHRVTSSSLMFKIAVSGKSTSAPCFRPPLASH